MREGVFTDALRWIFEQLAAAVAPRPHLSIPEWAEKHLILPAEAGTARPGPLSLALTPYLRAPMLRLDPMDGARTVNVVASAQSGKSLIPQCWIAWTIAENPGPIGVYLPTRDDARKYSGLKLQSIIDATPELRHRVAKVSSRSSENSSAFVKRFPRGSLTIAGAGSANALQMISLRDLVLEEVAGYEKDVGGRGKPSKQAKARQQAWETRGAKTLQVSAAGVQGECEVTEAHEHGTAHEIYLPCPHCEGFNRWEWEDMRAPSATIGAHFACRLCGGIVEHKHKVEMVAAHVFVPTWEAKDAGEPPPRSFEKEELARWRDRSEGGRQPSYRWWLYVSPFTTWDLLWADGQEAKRQGIAAEKTFWQQVLARAWDEGRDAPDHIKLHELREDYPEGQVPAGVYLLTGGADVQGDHVPWSVYGWAPGAEWFLIERGKCIGDPSGEEVWAQLAEVMQKRYPHAEGGELGIEVFGVDTGYKSNHVYNFVNKHAIARAMDGRDGWSRPYIGKPTRVRGKLDGRALNRTNLYPTGTWPLKSELQYSLRRTIEALPGQRIGGRGHFHMGCDVDYVRELVAEVMVEDRKKGKITRAWQVRPGFRNEETDIWVIARALAWGLGVGAPRREFDWEAARTKLLGDIEGDLFAPRRFEQATGGGRGESADDGGAADGEGVAPAAPSPPLPPPPAKPASAWGTQHTFKKRESA